MQRALRLALPLLLLPPLATAETMGERMKRVRAEMAASQQAQRPAAPKKTDIFSAIKAGDAEAVKEALGPGRSAAVHATDQYRKTPIEYAARENRPDIVRLLLQAGADVNYKDMTDRTVLGMAVDSGHSETVRVLLAAGADPRVPYGGKARRITVKVRFLTEILDDFRRFVDEIWLF